MKSKKSIVDKRREDILNYLINEETLTNKELSEKFNVSEITIRRDLDFLQSTGKLQRFHGGARINQNIDATNLILEEKKNRIAKKCAEFIADNDDIFINSSSTALKVIKYIQDKRVNIITNNAKAPYIEIDPLVNIILTGGNVSHPKNAMTGSFALNNLKSVASNITIVGISGITTNGDLTTSILEEVEINKYMLNASTDKNILVCDSSKFQSSANFKIDTIDHINIVITDCDISRPILESIEKKGIKVILV